MAAENCAQVAVNSDFLERVDYFMKKAAIAVMSESDQTADHDLRVSFGRKVLSGTARVK